VAHDAGELGLGRRRQAGVTIGPGLVVLNEQTIPNGIEVGGLGVLIVMTSLLVSSASMPA
jgi:hypothetical protein